MRQGLVWPRSHAVVRLNLGSNGIKVVLARGGAPCCYSSCVPGRVEYMPLSETWRCASGGGAVLQGAVGASAYAVPGRIGLGSEGNELKILYFFEPHSQRPSASPLQVCDTSSAPVSRHSVSLLVSLVSARPTD